MNKMNVVKAKKYAFVYAILFYPLVMFVIFYVLLNFNSLIMAFQERDFLGNVTDPWVGFENFKLFIRDLSQSPSLSVSIQNSVILYLAGLLIGLPLQLIFSYYLFRKVHGHTVIRFIVMLPSIISDFIVCLVFKKFVEGALPSIMNSWGAHDFPNLISNVKYTFGTVVFYSVWTSFTTALIMYSNAMNQVPDEIFESGRIDGIQEGLQELFYLALPMIFPTLSTFLITGFSGFLMATGPLVAFFMLNAPQKAYTMGYYYYVQVAGSSSQVSYPYLAAGGLLMTLVTAPLTFLLKWFLEKFGPNAEY